MTTGIRSSRRRQPACSRAGNRPSRWLIILAGTVTVATGVGLTLRPAGQRVDTAARTSASRPAGAVSPGPAATGPLPASVSDLARIADRVVAAPYETGKAREGSFEYTDIRIWSATDAMGNPAKTEGATVSVRRVRSWSNAGGSTGRAYAVDEARGCPAEDQRWTKQEPSPWGGPLSSAPDAVRRQLLGPPPNKGIDLWGQVGELYLYRLVPLATRRGVLRMLAGLPGVTVHRNVTDAAGRLGIAVTDTVGPAIAPPGPPVRHTLIFDPATGDLLATVLTDATNQGTPDYSTPPGGHSATLGYELYLTRRHTPTVDTPKPDC